MTTDNEPSVLDYARLYGLANDRRAADLIQHFTNISIAALPKDPPELFESDASNVTLPPERLLVPKEAAALIASIRDLKFTKLVLDPSLLPDSMRTRKLKMELPLLQTDHEMDMLHWGKRKAPNLLNEHFPLETLDGDLDQGMGWPLCIGEVLEEYVARSGRERIQMSKEEFLYFQGVLSLRKDQGSRDQYRDVDYKRDKRKAHLTPVMLPMSPTSLPFIPSSEVGHFELVSDHSSLFRNELAELDEQILGDWDDNTVTRKRKTSSRSPEHGTVDADSVGSIYTPLKPVKPELLSPPYKRQRRAVSKVRGPLTPLRTEIPTPGKEETRPAKELFDIASYLPPPVEQPESLSSEDIDTLFAGTFQPMAQEALKILENEQLQEADVVSRVKVPILDFSSPLPPWQECQDGSKTANEDAVSLMSTNLKDLHIYLWPTTIKAEKALNWVPFPASLGKIAPEEFPEDFSIDDFVGELTCLDQCTLVWKPEGLRILDEEDSDDEEFLKADFPKTAELESLVRRKQLEKQEDGESEDIICSTGSKTAFTLAPRKSVSKWDEGLQDTTFSPFSAIGSFMNVRKGEIAKVKQNCAAQLPINIVHGEPESTPLPEPLSTRPISKQQDSGLRPTPLLVFNVPSTMRYFVIASSVLSNIKLSNQIRQLYPSAELVERDFTLYVKRPQTKSKSNGFSKMTANDSIADEADILLSPGCGLILTTLPKIKQRSLPGQVARSPIKERIQRTAPRYEALFVLVSEGRLGKQNSEYDSFIESDIGPADSKSISELTAFCSSLNAEVSVIYIDGGEEELVSWTISMMVRYGVSDPGIKLLQDETTWEVFLRRAGMNAFAAQVVLAELKAPAGSRDGLEVNDQFFSDYGLSGFVKMSLYERINRFEHIFGGTRLLQRVSRNIDGGWANK